ncbi:GTPase [Corynebacterium uterequi]|uniref:50S ribosome-binding GTPase n=1 Tax=Corynebacterium uterequi TaxID=1072256 RepID=A0A0G3HEH1_9CORY|nr:GTPase [Corynebacterium uterequi]AKK10368.1 50S ribosome-binding GTPase [Corynebacterium uterequi]
MFNKTVPLGERLGALSRARELAVPYLPAEQVAAFGAVVEAGEDRRALSAEHTVVGFFGATGSGKTSLFNALVGEDLGASSPRRPTTSSPLAAVWQPAGSEALLDWLGVVDRRPRDGVFADGAGPLILLDLPDFDSVAATNREIATRLAGQVDVLVWVTDPEKYADKVIHEEFIRPHAAHAAVTLAVINKADTLRDADRNLVAEHFAGLLRADGLPRVSVIATSATTNAGVDELRRAIAEVARARNAHTRRIEADLTAVTEPWAKATAPKEVAPAAVRELSAGLARASGADDIAAATAAAYRKRLGQVTGWPVTSWLLRLRPDPLRRLGLREQPDELGVHRSSMPELDASRRAVANSAVRSYAEATADGLPGAWADRLYDRAEGVVDAVPAGLDRAATATRLPAQPSKAWSLVAVVQWLALVMALAGVLWYLGVALVPGVLTPLLGTDLVPDVEGWPVPTLLILGGVLSGIVLGLITAVFGGAIGSAVRSRTRRALRRQVGQVAEELVVAELAAVRQDYREFLRQVSLARGRRP